MTGLRAQEVELNRLKRRAAHATFVVLDIGRAGEFRRGFACSDEEIESMRISILIAARRERHHHRIHVRGRNRPAALDAEDLEDVLLPDRRPRLEIRTMPRVLVWRK